MVRRFLLLMAALWVAGCTLIPEYSRPRLPVPDQWPSGPAYPEPVRAAQAPPAADLDWRDYFKDPPLQALIEAGLKNNRDLRLAALNVERARALHRIRQVEVLPVVDATGRRLEEWVPGTINGDGRSYKVRQYRVQVGVTSWEIDLFGRIRSLAQSALEEYFATEQARRGAQLLLIAEIAEAYLTLAADRDGLELSRATLEAQRVAAELIRRRFASGIVSELDVNQSLTRVEAARIDVARFTEQLARDENALNLLVGRVVGPELLPDGLEAVVPPPALYAGLPSEVLLRRPDILQAESRLKAAQANIGAARAAFFPSLTLTGAVGTASGELSQLFKPGSFAWNFTPTITLPIFDPRTWAALEVTEVDRELALTGYEKAVQAAFRDVADALAQYGTIDEELQAQQALVDAASRTHRLSSVRYAKGIDVYLAVLDAQRSLYAARQGLIAVHLAKLQNQVRLFAALGGGGGDGPAYAKSTK